MTESRQSRWICAITLLYAGFTPDQIQEAESGVDVYGPEEGFTTTDRDSSSAISHIITRCEACGFELPDKIWPTGRRVSGEDYATYDIEKLGIDMVTWMDYINRNIKHLGRFINVNPQLFSHRATLYEVIGHCSRRHGALLAKAQSYQMFKSYLHYRRKTSRGAGRKKKIRRRRKSKRKSKKKTKRRKKRTKRRR